MLVLFGGALAVLILYAILIAWGWRWGGRQAPTPSPDEGPPISVVVAARNEAKTLPDLLDALDAQTHPTHEVVIVDDASTDETAAIAEAWAEERAHATVLQIAEPTRPRKKNALARGIEAARHDLLAFTDADCRPPPDWLSVLAATHA
ncbi:MAG TPA: glycosyltransferase, partial [Salinibacter sp.]|nr:glycosyltransferase [Salinibacter sp.]